MASMKPLVGRIKRADYGTVSHWAKEKARTGFARSGFMVRRLDEEGKRYYFPSYDEEKGLPPGAAAELTSDNPRLAQLRAAYEASDSPASVPTQWNDGFLAKNLSLAWFRGDNAYVWQMRMYADSARTRTYLTLLDIESRDRLGLLKTLTEDGLFGAFTFNYGDRAPVSRDLLDSVNEINYLDEQMGLSTIDGLRVLDIGAGYGRLAHRMATALDNLEAYDCTDAIAVSTFLCEYYTRFRGVSDRVSVVPLPEVPTGLRDHYDVAVNIHSFSECSHAAIQWWLGRIAERDIPWLLIVPNTPGELLSTEYDGSRRDFLPDVLAAGYEVADRRAVYGSAELREMIGVHDEFVLFRRR